MTVIIRLAWGNIQASLLRVNKIFWLKFSAEKREDGKDEMHIICAWPRGVIFAT